MSTRMHVIAASLCGLALLLLVVPGAVMAGEKSKTVTVKIDGEEGADLSFSISGNLVNGLVGKLAGQELDCAADLDDDTMAMLRHLDRRGEGSRYTLERDDEVIEARRRKGQLELAIHEDGQKKSEISMPWSIAACMMGDASALQAAKGAGELEVHIEDEGVLRIRIE